MEERYIAAVDIGSSKIAVGVARVEGGNMQIIYYREHRSDGVRDGAILNPTKFSTILGGAIAQAQDELGINISQVVTGMPRFEVRMASANIAVERSADTCITDEEVAGLRDLAMDGNVPENAGEVLLEAVAQSFSTEDYMNYSEDDIVGMSGGHLEGNFRLFIGSKTAFKNIDIAFNNISLAVARTYFTPLTTARPVLKDSETENGVALVEFGAGVTSVSVFHRGVLRYFASIPFGGSSITRDIRSEASISENLAENIKLEYGICMPDRLESLSEKILLIQSQSSDADKQISLKYLSDIITCREEEIINAILYEIQRSGFADSLKNGIVITGGASCMVNCGNLLKEMSGYNVRAGFPRPGNFTTAGCDEILEPSAAAMLGILLEARDDESLNCCLPSEPASVKEEEADVVVENDGVLGGFEMSEEEELKRRKLDEEKRRKEDERLRREERRRRKKEQQDRKKKSVKEGEDDSPSLWGYVQDLGGKLQDGVNYVYNKINSEDA